MLARTDRTINIDAMDFMAPLRHIVMRATPLLPVTDVRMINTRQPERCRLRDSFRIFRTEVTKGVQASLFRASCRACCPVCLTGEAIARVSAYGWRECQVRAE